MTAPSAKAPKTAWMPMTSVASADNKQRHEDDGHHALREPPANAVQAREPDHRRPHHERDERDVADGEPEGDERAGRRAPARR